MRISSVKIVVILFIAAVVALLVNFLQPEGLPLFSESKSETTNPGENLNPPPAVAGKTNMSYADTVKNDYNKMTVEKSRVEINDDLPPSNDYKSDSDPGSNVNTALPGAGSKDVDVNLSNLTTDIFNQPRMISLTQAYELYKDKVLFIDAREPELYAKGHIAGAINIPYFSINDYADKLAAIDKNRPLVTYCEGSDCDMATRLGDELFAKGYKKVFVFLGGWEEWENSNYPVASSDQELLLK